MRAIVQDQYGQTDVLRLRPDAPTPQIGEDDVLVRVHVTGINAADWHLMTGEPYPVRLVMGLRRPRNPVLGSDFSGVVEAAGTAVTGLSVGDEVMGEVERGTLADLVAVASKHVVRKPKNLTHEQAAAIPMGALTALQAVRDTGKLQPGQSVLVNGASSGVGIYAVQIAVAMGAEVTAICSGRNADMVRSLGASSVVDYTTEDVVATSERYDLIIDIISNRSIADFRKVLTERGRYVLVGAASSGKWFGMGRQLQVVLTSPFVRQTLKPMLANRKQEDLATIVDMVEAGQVTPVIDTVYPFEQAADAIAHVQKGHARGKVVVAI
ncbi:MAG: NAD(P)-dependent alcohol dehydrogenase [Actinomycetia bacterium]|nr:NAD(P)-dependent alcohol dehydrogenase [Actinomycetes bacterium]